MLPGSIGYFSEKLFLSKISKEILPFLRRSLPSAGLKVLKYLSRLNWKASGT